jgi:hypothetical protein
MKLLSEKFKAPEKQKAFAPHGTKAETSAVPPKLMK